jgi:hypothetical protein
MTTHRVLCLAAVLLVSSADSTSVLAQEYLWCYQGDQVYASVFGADITVYHHGAVYNCCPDYFQYDVSVEKTRILVEEREILTMPCDCLCCFDLAVTLADNPPGEYDLEFGWFDYETQQQQYRTLHVVVADVGQNGGTVVAEVANSGCVDVTAIPPSPDSGGSWGWLKALYR